MEPDNYLLVLTVFEGKNFPSKNQFRLVVEAKFNGTVMSTDPVEHASNPNFGTDLGWEVDRKDMHALKTARAPIKISCFAINKKTGSKEGVGYIILDSRLANLTSMKPQWFPLLNGKYTPRPELLLTVFMEYDTIQRENTGSEARTPSKEKMEFGTPSKLKQKIPIIEKTPPPTTYLGFASTDLTPILNDAGEFYQIGPADKCKDYFTLSVTIGFGANLDQLLPTSYVMPVDHRGFFFYYSLLGNDIQTDRFHDIIKVNFAPERASAKVRSSVPALQAFFCMHPGIQVHLCSEDTSLGSADISVKDLLIPGSTEIFKNPVTIENSYELKTSRHSQIYDALDTIKPVVGVVISIDKEEKVINRVEPIGSNSASKQHASNDQIERTPTKRPPISSSRRNLRYQQSPPEKLDSQLETQQRDPVVELSSDSESLVSQSSTDVVTDEPDKSDSGLIEESQPEDTDLFKPVETPGFDLCVDLKTIRNISIPFNVNCFLRYSYSHFGNVNPIETNPTVMVKTSGNLVYLPNGMTSFRFSSPQPAQLQHIFRRHPITVEMFHRDVASSQDRVLGRALISLASLVEQEKCHTINENGKTVLRQSHSQVATVKDSVESPIAELQVYLKLDEMTRTGGAAISKESNKIRSGIPRTVAPSGQVSNKAQKKLYEEQQIAEGVALELEQWKEWQEQMFLKELKEKEARHIKELTVEWTRRETEREMTTKRQLAEYRELEAKLKSVLADVEKRERRLLSNESEIQRIKDDLQAEYDRHVQDIKDASRRMKDDCDHKIELERDKNRILQDQCVKLQKQLGETAKKLEHKEAEFYAFRDKHTKPELKLQSDLNVMHIEKAELERKVNALTKSKVHYKQSYGRALKELARIKQAMQSEAQVQLAKQQTELEEMKLQYLTSQQKENIREEQHALKNLQLQIKSGSQHLPSERDNGSRLANIMGTADPTGSKKTLTKIEESMLNNLIEQKEELLRTGTYEADNKIILELDKQMRSIVSRARR